MPIYKKKAGKHHYRGSDGEIHVIKKGGTIDCEPEFLGGAISTFEEVDSMKVGKKKKKIKIEKEEEQEVENKEEEAKPKKKFKRAKE